MSNCKGCGAAIIWIKTVKGKNMPVDAKPVKAYLPRTPMGREAADNLDGLDYHLVDVYLTHWGTCPKVHYFKKKKG